MKAKVQYGDLIGTAAADISDLITKDNQLQEIGNYFNIDENRFEIIGVTIFGVSDFYCCLLCVDKVKSTSLKKHIVKIRVEDNDEEGIISVLFKRFNVVLYDRFKSEYADLDYDEEIRIDEIVEE